jgi:hypothetical protein
MAWYKIQSVLELCMPYSWKQSCVWFASQPLNQAFRYFQSLARISNIAHGWPFFQNSLLQYNLQAAASMTWYKIQSALELCMPYFWKQSCVWFASQPLNQAFRYFQSLAWISNIAQVVNFFLVHFWHFCTVHWVSLKKIWGSCLQHKQKGRFLLYPNIPDWVLRMQQR